MDQTLQIVTTNFTTQEPKIVSTRENVCFASTDRNCSSIPGGVGEGENKAYVRVGDCQIMNLYRKPGDTSIYGL